MDPDHADNVAPAIMGGISLIRSYNPLDITKLHYPKPIMGKYYTSKN
nr:hypothetical protein [Blattabacterium sp. (Cryptocercus kyebangensis)]